MEILKSLNKFIFKYRYEVIVLLAIVFYVISKIGPSFIDQELSGNLSVEFFGFLLIYYLIDRSITSNKEEEDRKRKQIGYRRLHHPLSMYMGFLTRLYKSTRKNPPDKIPETLSDMFDSEFIENCEELDWSLNPDYFPLMTWREYILTSILNLIKDLNEVEEIYFDALDNETLNLIEDIINSNFMYGFRPTSDVMRTLIQRMTGKGKIVGFFRTGDNFLKLISLIIQLINVINPHVEHPIKVDQSLFDPGPFWGTARLK